MKASIALLAAAWVTLTASAHAADDKELEAGRRLFTSGTAPSCSTCHVLRDAKATGEIGPSLDELKPDEARVANVLRTGLGLMPSFKASLSEPDLLLLAQYVAQASGASKP